MKGIKVTTNNTLQGQNTHEILGNRFWSHSYDSKSAPGFISCIYYCSKTAANKALCPELKKSILTITNL